MKKLIILFILLFAVSAGALTISNMGLKNLSITSDATVIADSILWENDGPVMLWESAGAVILWE